MQNSINRSATAALAALLCVGTALPAIGATVDAGISHSVLARLVRVCAPQVNSTTQAAIVAVESGGLPWVLHDDNDDRVYSPTSLADAKDGVRRLLVRNKALYGVRDRGVDVGLAQINSLNFVSLGVGAADMLDPCMNLHASAQIIASAYLHERAILSRDPSRRGDELALERALQVYNSGRPAGDDAYVRAIYGTLGGPLVREVGSGVSVPPLPVLPLHFAAFAPPAAPKAGVRKAAIAAARAHGTLFFHADNALAIGQPIETPIHVTGAAFVHEDPPQPVRDMSAP